MPIRYLSGLSVDSTVLVVDAANDRVGIGTASPAETLQVAGNVAVHPGQKFGWIYNPGTDNNIYNYIQTPISGGVAASALEISGSRWTNGNVASVIFTHQTGGQIMTIMTGGNVGIGTTAPNALLSISKTISSDTRFLEINNAGNNQFRSDIDFTVTSGGVTVGRISSIYPSSNNVGLSFSTYGTSPSTGLHERMRINGSDGNVGIGVASPNEKLHVGGNINAYINGGIDAGLFASTSAGSTTIALRSNGITHFNGGNVGIGTTSPTGTYGKLTVAGGIHITNDNNAKLEIGRYSVGAPNSYIKLGASSNSLRFTNNTDLADLMELTNSGNLGLGVTPSAWNSIYRVFQIDGGSISSSPSYNNISVASNVFYNAGNSPRYIVNDYATLYGQDDGIHAWYNAPSGTAGDAITFTQAMTLTAGGNVGIGTTSPNTILELGLANLSNPTNNQFLRVNAGKYNEASTSNLDLFNWGNNFGQPLGWRVSSATDSVGISVGRHLSFNTVVTDGSGNVSTATERMRITSGGNVVIGNTTAYGGLTVSDFSANDGNDSISLFYRGTAGNHESLIKFYDFRGQLNASLGNNLVNDGVGTQEARLVFSTSTGGSVTEKMRITGGGNVLIGTTADAGYKLDVSGTGRFSGANLTIGSAVAATNVKLLLNGVASKAAGIEFQQNGTSQWYIGNGIASEDNNFELYNSNGTMAMKIIKSTNAINFIGTFGVTGAATFSSSVIVNNATNDGVGALQVKVLAANQSAARIASTTNNNLFNFISNDTPGHAILDLGKFTESGTYAAGFIRLRTDGDSWIQGGNVGIGTTSPGTALVVNGGASAGATVDIKHTNSNGYSGIDFYENTGTHVGSLWHANSGGVASNQNAMTLAARNSGDKVYIVAGGYDPTTSGGITVAAGNVGIGTTNPTLGKLQVNGSSPTIAINSADNTSPILFLVRNGGTNGVGVVQIQDGGHLSFDVGATGAGQAEKMRLLANGNVGIGTTSPSGKLHIAAPTGTASPGSIALAIRDAGSPTFGFDFNLEGVSTGDLSLMRTVSGVQSQVMTFDRANGNVGIGTTAPAAKLEVAADVAKGILINRTFTTSSQTLANVRAYYGLAITPLRGGTGGLYFTNYDADTPIIQSVNSSDVAQSLLLNPLGGNVGIGTTAPGQKLQVAGNIALGSSANGYLEAGSKYIGTSYASPGTDGFVGLQLESVNAPAPYNGNYSQNIKFYTHHYGAGTGGTPRVTVQYDGNVGIGTTSPSAKLDISAGTNLNLGVQQLVLDNFANDGVGITFSRTSSDDDLMALGVADSNKLGLFSRAGIVFATGGASLYSATSEVMRITETGNVGIGTTAPAYALDVQSNTTSEPFVQARFLNTNSSGTEFAGILVNGTNQAHIRFLTGTSTWGGVGAKQWQIRSGIAANVDALSIYSWTAGSDVIYFNSSGNVGIGTTSPTEKLHVDGSTLITYNNSFQSTNSVGNKAILARVSPTSGIINYAEYATATNLNGFVIGSDDARVKGNITGDSLEFITNTSTRMTILSGGNVGINTTTPGSTLHVIGDVLIQTGALGVGVNPNATDGRIDASNDIVAFSTSDRRLKENITPIANALEKVKSLTGVEFDWKEETKSVHGYEGHDVGVIAQDVQAVLPEAVRTNDSGYLSVRYEKMIALLVEANKELADRVEQLEKLIK